MLSLLYIADIEMTQAQNTRWDFDVDENEKRRERKNDMNFLILPHIFKV